MNLPDSAQSGKNFYIALDEPIDHIFKSDDIISGKCCLCSPVDEDVGSVTISFHGTVKVRFVDTDPHPVRGTYALNNYQSNNHNSEDVLFAETRLLYRGPYTLRKNVLYEWRFQFQFPSESLPPSGHFGKGYGSATVVYELEGCRGRTSQDVASLEKRITPVNSDRNANLHSRTMFERIGAFKGMVVTMPLQVLPPRRTYIEPAMVVYESSREVPIRSIQAAGHHGLPGLFHPQKANIVCNIAVKLAKNLTCETTIPLFLSIITDWDLTSLFLQKVEVHLKSATTVISKLGNHRHTHESESLLFSLSSINLPLQSNSSLDIGKVLNVRLNPTIVPSFTYPRVEVHHSVRIHLVVECDDQKLKEDFIAEDVQVDSNRRPHSPLQLEHICIFQQYDQQSTSGPPQYPGIQKMEGKDITDAYLCLSQQFSRNFIPHFPVALRTREPAFLLGAKPRLLGLSPSSISNENATVLFPDLRHDALRQDQYLLDCILKSDLGFSATTMRTGKASGERLGYSWVSPTAPPLSLKARIREKQDPSVHFDIYTLEPEEERPPPSYSEDANQLSPIKILNLLLYNIVDSIARPTYASDILYIITEHRLALRQHVDAIDSKAASRAVTELEMLREPLMEIGVNVDGGAIAGRHVAQHEQWSRGDHEERKIEDLSYD